MKWQVGDNRYAVADESTDTIKAFHPVIRSAYDYYPFGMLMPGRYVSDTSEHCVTISRPTWAWKEVTVACWDVYSWRWPGYTPINKGTAVVSGDAVEINAPAAGDGVSFDFPVTANVQQQLDIDVERVSLNSKASVQIMEQEGADWVTLAEAPINVVSGGMSIPFTPKANTVRIIWNGPIVIWVRKHCISKLEWVEEDQLVTVCDEDKDKYRFGYNGQEKVNEWSGVGNFDDFGARGYDSRIGRFLSLDPDMSKYPNQSPYVFAADNPIWLIDQEGRGPVTPQQRKEFITNIAQPLVKALAAKGIEPKQGMFVVAQVLRESGWVPSGKQGQLLRQVHNVFNIKGNGDAGSVKIYTHEDDESGQSHYIYSEFRAYKSFEGAVDDYLSTLKRSFPKAYSSLMDSKSELSDFTSGLQHGKYGKYATANDYESQMEGMLKTVKREYKKYGSTSHSSPPVSAPPLDSSLKGKANWKSGQSIY